MKKSDSYCNENKNKRKFSHKEERAILERSIGKLIEQFTFATYLLLVVAMLVLGIFLKLVTERLLG